MKYLLVMFQQEVFPDSRWGTYGFSSEFVCEEFEQTEYMEEGDCEHNIVEAIGSFESRNPHGQIHLYKIEDVDATELINRGLEAGHRITKDREEKEKQKKAIMHERYKDKVKLEELEQLKKLKQKYESNV